MWKWSTQSAAVTRPVDGVERLTEELVEEAGEDNSDRLWPSSVCAVKNGINKMHFKHFFTFGYRPTSKIFTYWLVSRQLPIFLLELVSVLKADRLPE